MAELINAHKKMAMGITEGNKLKKGGKVAKYAEGGKVKSEDDAVASRALDSSRKQPLPKPTGKIATLKKGGMPKRGMGVTVAVAIPVKKRAS
jgi:hypothetical protein